MILTKEQLAKYNEIVSRGLCSDVGSPESQVCIEAAVCYALGLPHGDDPGCVSEAVRSFKIRLNDAEWSSPQARAAGLRDLGLAQLGSKGVVDDVKFVKRVAELTIRELLPRLMREVVKTPRALVAADRCEAEGTANDAADACANAANAAAYAADAAYAAAYAADAAYAAAYAADAAYACANAAAYAAANGDRYLIQSASIALRVLRELGSPGCRMVGV